VSSCDSGVLPLSLFCLCVLSEQTVHPEYEGTVKIGREVRICPPPAPRDPQTAGS